MKRILKIIALSLATAVVLGYFVFAAMSFSAIDCERICKDIDIQFVNPDASMLVTSVEVEQILAQKDLHPIGKRYKNIAIDSIESVLRQNTMLKSVECYNIPSGKLIIRIEQRKPQFLVMSDNKYYIGDEREIVPFSDNFDDNLPVISGFVGTETAQGKMFDFVKYINNNEFWLAQIEQIYVCADKKIEIITKTGDGIALLGTLDNYAVKLDKLRALYKDVFSVKGSNKYGYINLEYKNQIVCYPPGKKTEANLETETTSIL